MITGFRPHLTALLALALAAATGSADVMARRPSRMPRYTHDRHQHRNPGSYPYLEDEDFEGFRHNDPMRVREPAEIMAAMDSIEIKLPVCNPFQAPLIFCGYIQPQESKIQVDTVLRYTAPYISTDGEPIYTAPKHELKLSRDLTNAIQLSQQGAWIRQLYMVQNTAAIEYGAWLLPGLPELPPEDYSFDAYISRLRLPQVDVENITLSKRKIDKIHWLHVLNGGVQFSQAFISKNWYQGGNDHLALLVNFYWNVKLNQAYHPNLLFENTVSYKLGLNSTSQDKYHKYSITEDLLQWNMNFGIKARKKWYYSLTAQFKTQTLNSYPADSETRTAAFLSPAELNVGAGMTYSTTGRHNTLKFKAALSPLSYNMKMCLNHKVDATQFGITDGKRILNEVGSSSELTLDWVITSNISYRSRLFVFTDYENYSHDWENTLTFTINRFLSTQIYAHLRYDTAGNANIPGWRHWMLKEILSFGFAYSFSTK